LLILGAYISTLGIFFNFCEIYYGKKKSKLKSEDAFLVSARKSMGMTGEILINFLIYPIGIILFVVFIMGGRGCNRIESAYFYNQNKELISQSFMAYLKQSLLFHLKVIFCLLFNIIAFIVLLVSPIIIVRLFWTLGFWASISVLVLLSKQIAAILRIRVAAPIFSIILTLSGLLISLVGYML
jgi:hypothetical protein